MNKSELEARFEYVKNLTKLFKFERIVHLVITCISLIMILLSAGSVIYNGNADAIDLSLIFGSSGLITYTAGKLLQMWSQALKIISNEEGGSHE